MAVGLSMDCLAVAVASGVIMERVHWRPMLTMALAFGLFQALNPLIGWLGTNYFRHLIESVDHWIAFAILLFLGNEVIGGAMDLHFESAAMILALVDVGKWLEEKAKHKTGDEIEKLLKLAPDDVTVERQGVMSTVPLSSVKVGDVVVVKNRRLSLAATNFLALINN